MGSEAGEWLFSGSESHAVSWVSSVLLDTSFETVNQPGTAAQACDPNAGETESGKPKFEASLGVVSENKTK